MTHYHLFYYYHVNIILLHEANVKLSHNSCTNTNTNTVSGYEDGEINEYISPNPTHCLPVFNTMPATLPAVMF